MGRSGKSQHVYANGKGAVDISVSRPSEAKLDSLEIIVMNTTKYTRITRYKTFLHLDLAKNRIGKRAYYRNTKHGWIFIGEIKLD